jgi:hypothetical protein
MVMLAPAVFAKGTSASRAGLLCLIFCHFDRPHSAEEHPELSQRNTSRASTTRGTNANFITTEKYANGYLPSLAEDEPFTSSDARQKDGKSACYLYAPQWTEFRYLEGVLMHLNRVVRFDGVMAAGHLEVRQKSCCGP